MAIEVRFTIRCDRCEREQTVTTDDSWAATDDFHMSRSRLVREANERGGYGWKLMDRDGHEVYDMRLGPVRLMCGPCAEEYRRLIERQRADEQAFFKA